MAHKIRVMIIDQNKNTVETDMDIHLYRSIGIKGENIKQHRKRTELNQSVTEFLNNIHRKM